MLYYIIIATKESIIFRSTTDSSDIDLLMYFAVHYKYFEPLENVWVSTIDGVKTIIAVSHNMTHAIASLRTAINYIIEDNGQDNDIVHLYACAKSQWLQRCGSGKGCDGVSMKITLPITNGVPTIEWAMDITEAHMDGVRR